MQRHSQWGILAGVFRFVCLRFPSFPLYIFPYLFPAICLVWWIAIIPYSWLRRKGSSVVFRLHPFAVFEVKVQYRCCLRLTFSSTSRLSSPASSKIPRWPFPCTYLSGLYLVVASGETVQYSCCFQAVPHCCHLRKSTQINVFAVFDCIFSLPSGPTLALPFSMVPFRCLRRESVIPVFGLYLLVPRVEKAPHAVVFRHVQNPGSY